MVVFAVVAREEREEREGRNWKYFLIGLPVQPSRVGYLRELLRRRARGYQHNSYANVRNGRYCSKAPFVEKAFSPSHTVFRIGIRLWWMSSVLATKLSVGLRYSFDGFIVQLDMFVLRFNHLSSLIEHVEPLQTTSLSRTMHVILCIVFFY